jgi:DNA-binding NarL/FixJ family response regulator
MAIRVLLVDDNALFREGIAQILQRDGRFEVVGQASRGSEAVDAAEKLQPGLILIDVQMPGMTGIEAIRQLRARNVRVPVGVLTMFETDDHVRQSLAAGADGYLVKDATPADFCEAAAALAAGARNLVSLGDAGTILPIKGREKLSPLLTPRELEVLSALAGDAGNQAIAQQMGISARTLRNHIRNLYAKLGVYDRAQAVLVAAREGLIEVPRLRPLPRPPVTGRENR